jgi:hypothetical protein
MCKKYIVSVLITALLIQLYGCYSIQDIPKDEIAELKNGDDLIVYTKDATVYFFEESNYLIANDSLYVKGYVKSSAHASKVEIEKSIALTNIESIQQDEINPVTTSLLVLGSILTAAGVAFLILLIMYAGSN